MKLLVVMANYPFPPRTGSAIVFSNNIEHLSKRHSVNLVCMRPMVVFFEPAKFVEKVDLVSEKFIPPIIKRLYSLFNMLIGVPPSVSACASSAMKKKVRDKIKCEKFDVILLFEMSAIQYFPRSSFIKLAVNIEDPQSIRLNRMAQLSIWSFWQRLKLLVLAWVTLRYENKTLHKMGKIFLLSDEDVGDMRKQDSYINVARVSYGVEQIAPIEICGYEDRERSIVFSGNMYHQPNVDGGLFFLTDVFPLILLEYPSAVLWIVGANPDARIYAAAEKFGKQVVITGKVDDVAVYIKRATVSICPVRLKIGVQTKILEALSWGTPVVTTSAGNSGIGGVTGTHLWVEDDAAMFALRVCGLLHGRNWTNLSAEGRKLVAEHFSWENSAAQLERHLEALCAKN